MSAEVIELEERTSTTALMLDSSALERMSRAAEMMSSARVTVPKHLAGSPGDCFAVIMQATQWGMNPFAVAQKTHLVNGTLGYEAQLVIAVLNSSPLLATRLDYVWEGDWKGANGKTDKSDDRAVTVFARLKGESEPRRLRVSMAQAGVRNSPNWESDPRQQLSFLAAKKWGRLHAPDVMLGIYTPDELASIPERDMGPVDQVDESTKLTTRADTVRGALSKRKAQAQDAAPIPTTVVVDEQTAEHLRVRGQQRTEDVLAAISSAPTLDALRDAARPAETLDDDGKARAREAYKARKAELEPAPAVTFAKVADALNRAKTLDTLDIACDLIGEIADEQQRAELSDLAAQRRAAIGGTK